MSHPQLQTTVLVTPQLTGLKPLIIAMSGCQARPCTEEQI